MRVKQRLNNNAIVAYDEHDKSQEKVIIGKGVGFQVGVNDLVDCSKIEKVYVIENILHRNKLVRPKGE